ncbi:MAG: methylated-DNA-[protein]-cysteine S-methyltransferase [Arcticibacterium sp.]|jgi:methylated-DNA-[protein]-cysteine S-methyltransferase
MSETYTSYFESPIGILKLVTDSEAVQEVLFCDKAGESDLNLPKISFELTEQLTAYFADYLKEFSLRLNPQGTDFQKRVWLALGKLTFGKTATYIDIANSLGEPKVIRAAASANGKNPISIIIPCHRVIGKNGNLTGYAGGLNRKRWLLDHENRLANEVLELF